MSSGLWYHVVAEFYNGAPDSSHAKIFVNGVEKTTSLVIGSEPPSCPATSGFTLGALSYSGYNFTGSIDDVRISDRALTADEVRALYLEAVK